MADDDEKLALPSFGFGRKKQPRDDADTDATAVQPVVEPVPEPEPVPGPQPVPGPEPVPEPEPVRDPDPVTAPQTAVHEQDPAPRPLFADEVAAAPGPAPEARDAYAGTQGSEEPEPPPRRRTGPVVNGTAAALLVGLVVGALVVALTVGALRGCEEIQGTPSCGNPGFLLLMAILVLVVVLGSALLRLLGLPDPGSTSFLGVGLLAVVALLFLVDVLFAWWMVIAIPVTSMLTFGLSHWVTTTFVDSPD